MAGLDQRRESDFIGMLQEVGGDRQKLNHLGNLDPIALCTDTIRTVQVSGVCCAVPVVAHACSVLRFRDAALGCLSRLTLGRRLGTTIPTHLDGLGRAPLE